jgi:hypothetical protein
MARGGAGHWTRIYVIEGQNAVHQFLLDGFGRHHTRFPHQASRGLIGLNADNPDAFVNQKPDQGIRLRDLASAGERAPELGQEQQTSPLTEPNHPRVILPLLPFSASNWMGAPQVGAVDGWELPVTNNDHC